MWNSWLSGRKKEGKLMSENDYSKNIKKVILNFARSNKDKYSHIREEPTIYLKAPYEEASFYQFPYNPEICLTKIYGNKHRHIIFEVLDSQGKQPNLIIADIIQALLVTDINLLIFFTKNSKDTEKAEET